MSAASLLSQMLCLTLPCAALVMLHVVGRELPDAGVVMVCCLLAGVAGAWGRACGLARRARWRAAYLRAESPLSGWLRGGPLLTMLAFVHALPLAFVLVVATLRPQAAFTLAVLVLDVPLLVLLAHLWQRRLAGDVVEAQRTVLAWRAAQACNALLLVSVLAILALFQTYPDYAGVRLLEALAHASAAETADPARSVFVHTALQLAAAKDAAAAWLGQQVLPGAGPALALLGWLVLLATDALVVVSYQRLCVGTLVVMRRLA